MPDAFGQEQAFGEREHLHGEADVDRELEREPLPVLADVVGRAELAQERLDALVGAFVAADHDRQRPGLHLRDAPRHRRVEHRSAPRSRTRCRELAAHAAG